MPAEDQVHYLNPSSELQLNLSFFVPFLVLNALFSRTQVVYKHLRLHFINPSMDANQKKTPQLRRPSLTMLNNFQVTMLFRALQFLNIKELLRYDHCPQVCCLTLSRLPVSHCFSTRRVLPVFLLFSWGNFYQPHLKDYSSTNFSKFVPRRLP